MSKTSGGISSRSHSLRSSCPRSAAMPSFTLTWTTQPHHRAALRGSMDTAWHYVTSELSLKSAKLQFMQAQVSLGLLMCTEGKFAFPRILNRNHGMRQQHQGKCSKLL